MPGSSELSDALNPNFYLNRPPATSNNVSNQASHSPSVEQYATVASSYGTSNNSVNDIQQLPVHAPIYAPHRSELEDAINPAAVSPSVSRLAASEQTRQTNADPIRVLKALMQSLTSYKEAVESERRRRIAWESEQEQKNFERQTQMESRIMVMQQEIDSLRAIIDASKAPASSNSQSTLVSPLSSHLMKDAETPFNVEDNASHDMPNFVQGSSLSPISSRKRARSASHGFDSQPMKLRSRNDSRPQSIQSAMRNHILRTMDLETDKELPPSHVEEEELGISEPVRFVWEQTTKKSVHNGKMKKRVVSDIIANRDLYPLVPAQEFSKAKLDSVFEQAFTTLRQKYASQRGSGVYAGERYENKAQRSRRSSRKKIKYQNRINSRKKLKEYTHGMFDAAFQMECMSSEESSDGEIDAGSSDEDKAPVKFLRIRYLAWRSLRLHRLYQIVDEREEQERSTKGKRGVGRKDRRMGMPKDGNLPPPKGVYRWMISKKWLREAVSVNAKLSDVLGDILKPDDEVDWHALLTLGEESEEELPQPQPQPQVQDYMHIPAPQPIPTDHYQHQYYLQAQQWVQNVGQYVDMSQMMHPYPVV